MNKERLLAVADAIEQESLGIRFGMLDWAEYHEGCGTVACIAGHTVALTIRDKLKVDPAAELLRQKDISDSGMISRVARQYLELKPSEALNLFMPEAFADNSGRAICLSDVTPKIAVKVLRRAAETGRISWLTTDFEEDE